MARAVVGSAPCGFNLGQHARAEGGGGGGLGGCIWVERGSWTGEGGSRDILRKKYTLTVFPMMTLFSLERLASMEVMLVL